MKNSSIFCKACNALMLVEFLKSNLLRKGVAVAFFLGVRPFFFLELKSSSSSSSALAPMVIHIIYEAIYRKL